MAPKIVQSDPLFIGASDSSSAVLVLIKLAGSNNYSLWCRSMRIALLGKIKFGFVTGTYIQESYKEELHEQWEICNAIVLSWIMNTMSESLLCGIIYARNNYAIWEDLKDLFNVKVKGIGRQEGALYYTQASSSKEDVTGFLIPTDDEIFLETATDSITEEAPIEEESISDAAVLGVASLGTTHDEICQDDCSLP
ncbi:uncharacterized protein LOC124894946 [Capsicum annuum]|uniref:uncharacterized protein LOC124894946 n=1 Tax=Capsicum annuum TaxID=4072 RepID=UPI001FB10146|nr:uncharacterized protein LOC124894946 [Capsicum annuum]